MFVSDGSYSVCRTAPTGKKRGKEKARWRGLFSLDPRLRGDDRANYRAVT